MPGGPKSEGRNPNPERNPKSENLQWDWIIGHSLPFRWVASTSSVGILSDLGIRNSDFSNEVETNRRLRCPTPVESIASNLKRAFTLIELLVVIAILSILAALLLPALSHAKSQASKVTDINNLKQVMVALHLYATDDADVLPFPNWDGGGLTGTNAGWLYAPDLTVAGTNRFRTETGTLWPSLHTPKVYVCPMDNTTEARYSAQDGQVEERNQQLSSYAMNGAVVGYMKRIEPPVKLSAMHADDCAFWETDESDPYYFNDGANYPYEPVSKRHNQGAIQAAFDTSVSYIRFDVWTQMADDDNRNSLWCYPNSPDGH
jgi:prepilin-type N-terminal cleavage/methylation domain-containing protein